MKSKLGSFWAIYIKEICTKEVIFHILMCFISLNFLIYVFHFIQQEAFAVPQVELVLSKQECK